MAPGFNPFIGRLDAPLFDRLFGAASGGSELATRQLLGQSGGTPTPQGDPDLPPGMRRIVIPGTNNVVIQQWDTTAQEWITVASGSIPQGGGGGAGGAGSSFRPGELDLLNRQLAEDARHNRVTEANVQRQRALDAASQSMSAFLRATEAADARRLAAFDVSTALLPSLVDPNQEFFGGGPGGALASASSRFGLPFTPSRVQHKQLVPASLAIAPEVGGGGQSIQSMLQAIMGGGS